MADMGVGEMMLLGSAIGGGTAAATGGNVLQGALLGGAAGGIGGAAFGGLGASGAGLGADVTGIIGSDIASMTSAGASQEAIAQALMANYGMTAEQAMAAMGSVASGGANALNAGVNMAGMYSGNYAPSVAAAFTQAGSTVPADVQAVQNAASNQALKNPQTNPAFMKDPLNWMMQNPGKTAAAGLGIYTLGNVLKGGQLTKPNTLPAYNPVSAQQMGLGRTLSSSYQPQLNAMYNRGYAAGGSINVAPGSVPTAGVAPADLATPQSQGISSLAKQYGIDPQVAQQTLSSYGIKTAADGGLMSSGKPDNVDFMGGDMYPQSQIQRSYYATPSQMPTSAQQAMASYEPKTNPLTGEPVAHMAEGGITSLGSYSDGGRLLKGPGDGMSDNIPATIAEKQPARLADGEFVVPADVVSHLGNGSTDAGAKQLYSMMDKVRKARTGRKAQGKQIKAGKYLPA